MTLKQWYIEAMKHETLQHIEALKQWNITTYWSTETMKHYDIIALKPYDVETFANDRNTMTLKHYVDATLFRMKRRESWPNFVGAVHLRFRNTLQYSTAQHAHSVQSSE